MGERFGDEFRVIFDEGFFCGGHVNVVDSDVILFAPGDVLFRVLLVGQVSVVNYCLQTLHARRVWEVHYRF